MVLRPVLSKWWTLELTHSLLKEETVCTKCNKILIKIYNLGLSSSLFH